MALPEIKRPGEAREVNSQTAPTRSEFARLVRDALGHLHDPVYLQAHRLAHFVPVGSRGRSSSRSRALGDALLEAVDALRPPSEVPSGSRSLLGHQVLRLRFVEGLKAQAIEDRLAIGRTTYYLEQDRALGAVSSYLWERWFGDATWDGDLDAHEPRTAPPLRLLTPSARPRHNLPTQLTSFVGRERDLAEVKRLVGTTRLLTLTGAGGCGKTRLAYQAATDLLAERPEEYPHGAWVAELASVADLTLVPQTVAIVLGVREASGRSILESLVSYLKPRRLLLLLDNCEHLLDACARLADSLLRGCPELELLVTSREALRIAGETVWHVPSLPIPLADPAPSLDSLIACDSVCLFVDRARAAAPDFSLGEQHASAVAEICRRLDGIPLAIELAAARVRALSPEQIAPRLDHDFLLLTGGSRAALPRQQTLKATLDWSHNLLGESERRLARRLSVFRGGFTLEAAEEVCSGDGIEESEVVNLLTQLVDKSLVEVQTTDREGRFRLLEPIRQYAWHRLKESGEAAEVSGRHRDHYLALAESAVPGIGRRDQLPGLMLLVREHDNLRAALDWSRRQPDGASYELRLALRLAPLWQHLGYREEARLLLPDLLDRTKGLMPDTRARLLPWVGTIELFEGKHDMAREHYEEGLALARMVGDQTMVALVLECLAWLANDLGRFDEARALLEEALTIARESGDRLATAAILKSLGEVLDEQRDDAAEAHLEESAAIARDAGDRWLCGLALMDLGVLALGRKDYPRARTLLDAARAVWGDRASFTGGLSLLVAQGDLARAEGDYDAARACYRQALIEVRHRMVGTSIAQVLARLAGLNVAEGRNQRAVWLFGALTAWCASVRMPRPYHPHPDQERDLAIAREALGEEAYARIWTEGQAMSIEQAVECALQDSS